MPSLDLDIRRQPDRRMVAFDRHIKRREQERRRILRRSADAPKHWATAVNVPEAGR